MSKRQLVKQTHAMEKQAMDGPTPRLGYAMREHDKRFPGFFKGTFV